MGKRKALGQLVSWAGQSLGALGALVVAQDEEGRPRAAPPAGPPPVPAHVRREEAEASARILGHAVGRRILAAEVVGGDGSGGPPRVRVKLDCGCTLVMVACVTVGGFPTLVLNQPESGGGA